MPPKSKFKKEEIINAGLKIVRDRGIEYLTARSLALELNSSPRPIFTIFNNMQELQQEIKIKARKIYSAYVNEGLKKEHPFKGVGEGYIRFAVEESHLFWLLFMNNENKTPNIDSVLNVIEENYDKIITSIINEYALDEEIAKKLYQNLWIYTHGIAVLMATKVCNFTNEEISTLLTDAFLGLLIRYNKGR